MKYVLDFIIPGAPKISANGSHGHWALKAKERKMWRGLVVIAVGNRRPLNPLEIAKVTFIRATCREPDYDNLTASMKAIRDGLVDARVCVNDKTANMPDAKYQWVRAPRGHSYIRVLVEEI